MNKNNLPLTKQPDPTDINPKFDSGDDIQPTLDAMAVFDVTQPPFPIIGIGASAGGLEALEQFLKNVPPNSGMSFIIVQHLDPTHKDVMVELLQRTSSIPVIQVTDRMMVDPNCVYVIPPNKDMSILHGVLHLLPPSAPRGLRLPIDYFFRSLADDLQERSVGVILSGMGSDGTLGLRAIKEKAGVVFVQAPSSAKFDGMPRSAIDAGLADVVAAVEELPEKINAYFQHTAILPKIDLPLETKTQSVMEKILILLRSHTGHDFSLYKRSTIYRRIERRMGLHQVDKIAIYLRFLQENPQEIELLFKELLIGVTSFFRDPTAWEQLQNEVVPALLACRAEGGILRAWTPGCSTGEEAYSLAMIFRETIEKINPMGNFMLQIFATDLEQDAIDKARLGFYPTNIAADVPPERLHRFFIQEEHGYRVNKEIREMVVFAPQNLVMDPPFTRLDLLICRNLLIYLAPELQKKLIPLFHYCLKPDGTLFLGSAETIGSYTHLFAPLDGKQRLYRRLSPVIKTDHADFSSPLFPAVHNTPDGAFIRHTEQKTVANIESQINQELLQRFSPAAVLVNNQGDILYFKGHTGKYLEPPAGKANLNILAMTRDEIRYDLSAALQKAIREKGAVTVKNLSVGSGSSQQAFNLILHPMDTPESLKGTILIVFNDIATPAANPAGKTRNSPSNKAHLTQLEQELQRAREELQTTHEEMQTSQEELKSTNEELQSTNEELQSTNEELTTSKEEMQSMNEELQTVNHELQARVEDLSRSNNDMKNLLNSTDIATLFLDEALHVRRYTSQATKLIKLISGDAGRPITDIASELLYPELAEDVQEVLQSLVFIERSIATRDGRWFTVRIMPYRTLENRIDGVVITFLDVSKAKKQEEVMLEALSMLQDYSMDSSTEQDGGQTAEKALQKVRSVLEKLLTDPKIRHGKNGVD